MNGINRSLATLIMATALGATAVAQDDAADSQPGRADSDSNALVAALRDGATIELVAVIRVQDSGDVAWHPNGNTIQISDDWPDVLRVRADNPTHGFIFRFKGFKNGQGVGWDTALTSPLPGESVKEFLSVSGSFPDRRSIDIRVGVLDSWGPWQPTDADGTITNRVKVPGPAAALYRSIHSLNVMGTSKPKIGLNRNAVSQPLASLADYEIVAVDTQGEKHRRRGVGIWNDEQVPFFDLGAIDLHAFEFRLRPYTQWAEFTKVPLEADATGAEVSVTEPEAANREPFSGASG